MFVQYGMQKFDIGVITGTAIPPLLPRSSEPYQQFCLLAAAKKQHKPDGVSRNSLSLFTEDVAPLSCCMWINTSCVKYRIYKSKQEANAASKRVCVYLKIYEVPLWVQREKVLYFVYTQSTSASLQAGCLKSGDGLGYLLIQYLTFPRGKMADINNSKLL